MPLSLFNFRTNPSPHAPNCTAKPWEHVEIGQAFFCPVCERRLGFLPDEAAKAKIVKALENDCK